LQDLPWLDTIPDATCYTSTYHKEDSNLPNTCSIWHSNKLEPSKDEQVEITFSNNVGSGNAFLLDSVKSSVGSRSRDRLTSPGPPHHPHQPDLTQENFLSLSASGEIACATFKLYENT
jgi:hypothetical protein